MVALCVFVVGCGAVFVLFRVLAVTDRNHDAIRVNCILLSNAILESGAGGPAAEKSPQRKLNALYVRAIARALTSAERRRAARLQAQVKSGSGLTFPDCDRIAEHPETVRAIPMR